MVNARFLYKRHAKLKKRRKVTPQPLDDFRFDTVAHWLLRDHSMISGLTQLHIGLILLKSETDAVCVLVVTPKRSVRNRAKIVLWLFTKNECDPVAARPICIVVVCTVSV